MTEENKWCFAWYEQPLVRGQSRAALQIKAKWPNRGNITISFLDGDPALQERVKEAAMAWVAPGMANLTFDFRKNTNKTDVRISFQYEGSWSMIGTTCRNQTDLSQPTMNFGWLQPNTSSQEVNRVVLHEFGHMLGLIHEHQSPGGKIRWNRKQVIHDLGEGSNHWSLAQTEFNMFKPYKRSETNYTQLDPQSIMMYPIPANWTLNGFLTGMNNELSQTDCSFIHQVYP
jgi:hypothetical protein